MLENNEPLTLSNLPLQSMLQLDIQSCAEHIETVCGGLLLPPPKGVYVVDRAEPVMQDGQTYYIRTGGLMGRLPIKDLSSIRCGVYDENDKLVIPLLYMLKKDKFISNQCFMPYRGLKIIEILINEQYTGLVLPRKCGGDHFRRLQAHLQPFETDEAFSDLVDKLRDAMSDVLQETRSFMGEKYYHIYLIKQTNALLSIENYGDFRIFDWTQRMQAGTWK